MLAARALGKALRGPKAAEPLLAFAGSSKASQGAASPSWTSILESYTSRSTYNGSFALFNGSNGRDKDETTKQSPSTAALRYLNTTSTPPTSLSSERASLSHRGLATTPGGSPAMDTDPAGGGGFMLLSGAHATLASLCYFIPEAVANVFFPGAALPQGMQTQVLVQLLGCGLAAGSASCFALKQYADAGALNSPTAQRLQLGLMGFSAAAIGTHLMYSPAITVASLASGAVVMGATGDVAYNSYKEKVGNLKIGEVVGRYFGAVPDHLRIENLQSGLFSLLTPTLALAGASYLFMPGSSLAAVFGYVKDTASFFFWQSIGGGLLTIAPALTYSLKKEADAGKLGEPAAKTLSAGLLVTSLGHLAVLAPMVMHNQGGDFLPYLVAAWSIAAGAGASGLMASAGGASSASGSSGAAAAGKR